MTSRFISVVPAYGRDYKSAKAVKAAWAAGEDFADSSLFSTNGLYINKQDADAAGLTVLVRFDRQTKITSIKPQLPKLEVN